MATEPIPGEFVTYASANFVHYVATSIDHTYFATTEGIIRFNKIDNSWEEPLTGAVGIDSRDIRRIWVDAFDEKLFAQTGMGYFEYDLLFDKWFPVGELPKLQNQARHVPPPPVMYAPIDFNYSANGRLIDAYGRLYAFTDVLDDNSGTLWIGTWGNGPARAGSSSDILELLPFGLIQNRVNALVIEDSLILTAGATLAESRTGITIHDRRTGEFSYIESGVDGIFASNDINCLETDRDFLYIGTTAGLMIYDRQTNEFTREFDSQSGLTDDNVICLEIIDDTLIVGTERGLTILTSLFEKTKVVQPAVFENHLVYDIEHADSAIWIATDNGAYRLGIPGGRVQKFQDPSLILYDRVYDIARFRHQLWFSADAGMLQLDMVTGETTPYPEATDIRAPRSLAVNGTIAAKASSRGFTLTYHNRRKVITREFTTDDGLPSSFVFSLELDGDFLWIGSDRGLTRFWWNNPDRLD